MARAVRFTKPEREWLRWLLRPDEMNLNNWSTAKVKLRDSIVAKLDAAEVPEVKERNYLSVKEAVTAFQSMLDRRLVLPPNGAGPVYAIMQAKLKSLGLTYEQCQQIAQQAGVEWQGNIKAQSLLNQAEKLLHDYQNAGSWDSESGEDVSIDSMTEL